MNIVLRSYGKRSLTWFRSSYANVRYPTTSEYVERISSGLVNQVRGKERCSRARLVYDPVIQRDRNDEKKNPEKRERLNISKRSEESRRAGGRWWETRKVQHSSGPSSILRLEKRHIYYSYPELWQNCGNFLGPIRSFDIVNWVNLFNPPRDLRSASRGETSRFDPCPIFCRGYRGDLNPARDLLRVDRRLELDQRVSHVRYQDAISMSRFRCLFPLLAIDPGTGKYRWRTL